MRSRRVVITLLQLSVLLALLVVLYRLSIHDQWIPTAITGDNDEDDKKYVPIVPVSIGTVVKTTLRSYVAGYGVVEPQPARPGISSGGASVNSPARALVASVQVVEGQPVKRGQPLFSLDDRAVAAQIARAKQDAESTVRIAREFDQAFESKAVPQSQVLRAHAASDAAQAALAAAEAQRATLVLVTPIDGVVTQIRVRAGEVTPVNLAAVELVDPDRLVVAVQVPQWQLHELKVGQPAVLTANQIPASQPASQPGSQPATEASVAYIDPEIDSRTGLGQVDVTVPPGFGYRVGQFVSLRIVTAQHDDCLAVPAGSIVQDANGVQTVSLVEHEYHQAFRQIVTVGIRENGLVEILNSDLKAGQPIVTTGAYALIDGSQIEVIPEKSAPMKDAIARFAIRNTAPILFLVLAVCLGGAYAALHMPSSVFPQVNFPRAVILINNGVMPADEMTASITRPIEEAMKDIPGCRTIRSSTGRGSAEVDVFFAWDVDMQRSELYVLSRLSQLQSTLPATATTSVNRMTFAAFPIIGVSLTRPHADPTRIWETARYELKPRLLRIPGVASVDVLGGETPEYHVTVDPRKLIALHLGLPQIVDALRRHNLVAPAGVHEQDNNLYLAVVDGRLRSIEDIENLTIPNAELAPIPVKSFATVTRDIEPQLRRVSADGQTAVLLNVYAQPDGSTVDISRAVNEELKSLRKTLPADAKLAFFYDQSLLVRNSVRGVWEAIGFGLILSIVILFLFLRSWTSTLIAVVVIPVAVLFTVLMMRLLGMGFNLMTLGGIAAAIGLVIDDAIVVVEAIYLKLSKGLSRADAVHAAIGEIFAPLMGSTLTPVVVFIPLAFLDGLTGVFFRALAITMAVSLIASLVLALTLTPALAAWIIRGRSEPIETAAATHHEAGGPILRGVIRVYEVVVVLALRHRWFTAGLCVVALFAAWVQYGNLDSNFLPAMDEGGFVIDYTAPPGSSLTEIDRQMRQAEKILSGIQDIESFSRRSGAALGFALVEPNTGDFLVKLKDHRQRDTKAVIADVRARFNIAFPLTKWDFPGILSDLIGDLTLADQPIEVKIFSTNDAFLREASKNVVGNLNQIHGVVDIQPGIIETGPTVRIRVHAADAEHFGLTTDDVSQAVNIAMLGREASTVLEADRLITIRVKLDPKSIERLENLNDLPLRAADGSMIRLRQVADVVQTAGEIELHRDDLRQNISVVAELEGRDLGSTMRDIKAALENDPTLPPVSIEYGGAYQEQQESFRNLQVVLGLAIVLVFMVALLEFRSFYAPIAIVFGALLSTFGIVVALHLTGTSLSVVAFLGAIIGMGIVHKNGILMLDHVHLLHEEGMTLEEALVYAGRRRLRPVLMTSLAAAMGMLPLAWGVGSGTDMLRPLAITVIGAVCVSVLLSLIATPVAYYLLLEIRDRLNQWRGAISAPGFAEEERQQQ